VFDHRNFSFGHTSSGYQTARSLAEPAAPVILSRGLNAPAAEVHREVTAMISTLFPGRDNQGCIYQLFILSAVRIS
jgi:hypothetical protein